MLIYYLNTHSYNYASPSKLIQLGSPSNTLESLASWGQMFPCQNAESTVPYLRKLGNEGRDL